MLKYKSEKFELLINSAITAANNNTKPLAASSLKNHIKGFDIAGKTGTAQKVENGKYSKENYVSSFAAIYPSYEPKYVCIISIDSANSNKGYHWAGISVAPTTRNKPHLL